MTTGDACQIFLGYVRKYCKVRKANVFVNHVFASTIRDHSELVRPPVPALFSFALCFLPSLEDICLNALNPACFFLYDHGLLAQ